MTKVFIDGSAGTTGLRIYERLGERRDIELIKLDEAHRKDPCARSEAINKADVAFLCLPDAAAIEAAKMAPDDTVIIDTSTAHRTSGGWTYGFPELFGMREKIASSKRIANPGCHASGFVALVAPLVELSLISKDEKLSCFSLTGYSGGGKKMIADYECKENENAMRAPRMYALTQEHKHLAEMKKVCGIEYAPIFSPVVSSYYSGMQVTVPLFASQVKCGIEEIKKAYKEYYGGHLVFFEDSADESGFLSAQTFSGRDDMQISVFGNDERITLVSRFDNLGKGASGAAIQNLNIALGIDETTGLCTGGKNQ